MKNIIIIAVVALALYYFYPGDNSPESIAKGIYFDGQTITYNEETFQSEWTKSNNRIQGHVRLIESNYNKNMPIITTTLIITTGDFSDPELVRIDKRSNGYMLYQLKPKQKPQGTIVIYHMIPGDISVQNQLSTVQAGDSISLLAKISTSGELRGERAVLKFAAYKPNEHVNTKLDADYDSTLQLILFVDSVM